MRHRKEIKELDFFSAVTRVNQNNLFASIIINKSKVA